MKSLAKKQEERLKNLAKRKRIKRTKLGRSPQLSKRQIQKAMGDFYK